MKLFVKNKLVSFGGSSFVTDEAGNKVFKVKGKIFSPTHKKKIYDSNGELRYIVRNKFWNFFSKSCFIYDGSKQKIAMLTRGDFDVKNKYVLKGFEDEILIQGSFASLNMEIQKNGQVIGKISREFTIVRDAFTLEIFDDTEDAFLVALVIAIDNITDSRRNDR